MDLRQSCWADGPEESGRVGNWDLMKFSKIQQGLSQDRRGVINSEWVHQRWTRMVREHLPCSEGLREPGADTAPEEIGDLVPWGHQGCVTCTEVQGRRNSSGQVLKQERFRLEIGKSFDILRHWKFPQRCWAVCSWRFLIWGWLNPEKPRMASELSLFEQEFGLQNSWGPFQPEIPCDPLTLTKPSNWSYVWGKKIKKSYPSMMWKWASRGKSSRASLTRNQSSIS